MAKYRGIKEKCDECKYTDSAYGDDYCGNCIHGKTEDNFKLKEQRVLSADDAWRSYDGPSIKESNRIKVSFYHGFNKGDKNGQLREWQRPEQVELREALEDWCDIDNRTIDDPRNAISVSRLRLAFYKLKPPKGV